MPTGICSFWPAGDFSSSSPSHGKITCEEARRLAIAILGAVVKGDDPAEERATGRKAITMRELCERYLVAAQRGLIVGRRGLPKKTSTIADVAAELTSVHLGRNVAASSGRFER